MRNIENFKELSKGYRELADLIDEMIAFEESGEDDQIKEESLLGRFILKSMSLQKLAD